MSAAPALTFHNRWFPGVIGGIAALHARHYAASHGFGPAFEAKVARELGAFLEAGQGFFRAVSRDGQALGSLALEEEGQGVSHLRWVILDASLRGQGIARRWLHEAILHACHTGQRLIYLWTLEGLPEAARLYAAAGFREVERLTATQWGMPATEIRMELARPPQRAMS